MSAVPPLFVPAEVVLDLLDVAGAVAALREAYAVAPSGGVASARSVVRGDGARLRTHAAVLATGDLMGAKLLAQPRSSPSTYLIALLDQEDGQLVALLDGAAITAVRTAATTALAVDALAAPGSLTVGLLGSGAQARGHARALAAVRPVDELVVHSTTPERRQAFAEWVRAELGIGARAVADPVSAVASASVVVAAARSHGELPVLDGDRLPADCVVASIGSTLPEQRELDSATWRRAGLVVADEPREVYDQSGDCLAARLDGVDVAAKLASLHDLVGGRLDAERTRTGVRVFTSVGSGLQDLAVARLVLHRAQGHPGNSRLTIRLAGKG